MIKIRYAELPAGLHIRAVASGRDTIIYLLPGLTAAQRQAALRRARSSARMGQGPRLPVAGVTGAVMIDRMRTTIRNGAAAMRGHPGVFAPPFVIIMTAAVAYVLLVSVNIRIHVPQASGSGRQGAAVPAAVAPPVSRADDPGARRGSSITSGQSQRPTHKRSGGGHGATGASPSPAPSPARPTAAASPSPSVTPSAGGTNSTGSGSGSPGPGGVCVGPGPSGACQSP